ncbi:pantothenate transporter liz1 [Penicillium waksmanii]|uniref:pantothenate transporter liz1 n=1 Tax=Penicillium waksmanii TaxID=69791 RepID=UPI00254887C4|nr:pantothenate transporter liz1 [Penicillium waksmanii]KAJ5974409.1 pantothenate transporter liz1 [Penicillium waksmanii]
MIFPQTMAPTFKYGFPATFGLVIAAIIAVVVVQVFILRDKRKEKETPNTIHETKSRLIGIVYHIG